MDIHSIYHGTRILRRYVDGASLQYIANSFPNGTPDNPKGCYISVCVPNMPPNEISEKDKKALRKWGWREDSEGDYWILTDPPGY